MSEFQDQCPICFETIGEKNVIITECGHKFHTSCLMTNITHNGFGCPYCRTLMTVHSHNEESILDDESISDDDSISDDESISDDDSISNHESISDDDSISNDEELYSDYSLQGLRFFTSLLEEQQHDEEDNTNENDFISNIQAETSNQPPSLEFVTNALKEQGVTYEHLVVSVLALFECEEYKENESFNIVSGFVWDEIRTIISNYSYNVHSTLNEID